MTQAAFARALPALHSRKARLFVAYSGGCDSSVLLCMAAQFAKAYQLTLTALHVNYGVSPNAQQWQEFCIEQCRHLGVECVVKKLNLSCVTANFEQVARELRYKFFAEQVGLMEVLLTGHHRDDQAETVLMRLLRGSGVRGGAGIAQSLPFGDSTLVRPLLSYSKKDIEAYARENAIRWIVDESNETEHYDRNYLRNKVMPLIQARWPKSDLGLLISAQKAKSNWALLQELGQIDLRRCALPVSESWFDLEVPLNWQNLCQLSEHRIINAIDTWVLNHGEYSVPRARLTEWLSQIEHAEQDSKPLLVHENLDLRYFAGEVHLLKKMPRDVRVTRGWDMLKAAELQSLGLQIQVHRTQQLSVLITENTTGYGPLLGVSTVEVFWREGGERVRQQSRGHNHSYKKCLQQYGIPPWERDALPMIRVGEKIVWSGALGQLQPAIYDVDGSLLTFELSKINL